MSSLFDLGKYDVDAFNGIPPLITDDYKHFLKAKTPQGNYIYSLILGGDILIRHPRGEASIKLNRYVPPDSICEIYINRETLLYQGRALNCPKN